MASCCWFPVVEDWRKVQSPGGLQVPTVEQLGFAILFFNRLIEVQVASCIHIWIVIRYSAILQAASIRYDIESLAIGWIIQKEWSSEYLYIYIYCNIIYNIVHCIIMQWCIILSYNIHNIYFTCAIIIHNDTVISFLSAFLELNKTNEWKKLFDLVKIPRKIRIDLPCSPSVLRFSATFPGDPEKKTFRHEAIRSAIERGGISFVESRGRNAADA